MKLPRVMGFQRGLAPFGGVQRQGLWAGPGGSPAGQANAWPALFPLVVPNFLTILCTYYRIWEAQEAYLQMRRKWESNGTEKYP